MSISQWVGLTMLVAFLLTLFIFSAKELGFADAIKLWSCAAAGTAFLLLATTLLIET